MMPAAATSELPVKNGTSVRVKDFRDTHLSNQGGTVEKCSAPVLGRSFILHEAGLPTDQEVRYIFLEATTHEKIRSERVARDVPRVF